MNEFKQYTDNSVIKKKSSIIISFFKLAFRDNHISNFFIFLASGIAGYILYHIRDVFYPMYANFTAWLALFDLSFGEFVILAVCTFVCIVFGIYKMIEVVYSFHMVARHARILSHAPMSIDEMQRIGATTQLEYCLIMSCYLMYSGYISLDELYSKRTSPENNPAVQSDEHWYHIAIRNFENNTPISPIVRQWCIDIMQRHGVLDEFKSTFKDSGYENAEYIYSLLFPNENHAHPLENED